MRFPSLDRFMTGVALPVSALRSKDGLGCGEFADLAQLGAWCAKCGIEVIQILPVNDTGFQNSPYSALSAFALHPLYVRIQDLPEVVEFADNEEVIKVLKIVRKQRKHFDSFDRLHYFDVLLIKLSLLKQVYQAFRDSIIADRKFRAWIRANAWVRIYAVFCHLKEKYGLAAWKTWPEMQRPTAEDIERFWKGGGSRKDVLFHAWVQWRLEEQLRVAVQKLEKLGVHLKGDLPILMNEDSADVWASPNLFDPAMRAGAPPDMFSALGQNWGFPVYEWDSMAEADYAWWKDRLRRADLFYHAYRIDHVLGFFRMWRIPSRETSGVLGLFHPAARLARADLQAAGFADDRIAWLSQPHVPGGALREFFGDRSGEIFSLAFDRLGNEDLYLFKPTMSEASLDALDLHEGGRRRLLDWYRDRTLIEVAPDRFAPAWYFHNSSAWKGLDEAERQALRAVFDRLASESEQIWEREGEKILSILKASASMLACAEDLGVIPDCVPRVLERLGILGLRIPRWTRRYKLSAQPYISPAEYPYLTVCAASVHDTSTLRQWWETEAEQDLVWNALGLPGSAPAAYTCETAYAVIQALLRSGSALAVFQIQDFFAVREELRVSDPRQERINVPGTVDPVNWTYRMPFSLERLGKETDFNRLLADLTKERAQRRPSL